jgi:ABC-type phosphate transport system substrate-binding protein
MKISLLEIAAGLALLSICFTAYAVDFVVIVNAKNSAGAISKDQIAQSFLGSTNTFSPIDQADGSAIRVEFYKTIAEKDPSQVRAIWSKLVFTGKAKPPKQFATSEEVKKQVGSDVNAIGYIEKSAVDSTVKVVYPAN